MNTRSNFGAIDPSHRMKKIFSCVVLFLAAIVAYAQPISDGLDPGASLGIHLGLNDLPNLRDIGGYVTTDGMNVVRGKTYRSNAFYPMSTIELARLQALGLKHDYDLRTSGEIEAQPDILPPKIIYTQLNVMADHKEVILPPAQIAQLLQDPQLASSKLGGVDGVEALFTKLYRDFVTLPSAQKSYKELYVSLLDQKNSPNVFHCTNGKDRTGWGAAALLALLGVPEDKVYEDYLRSNKYLIPIHQKEIDLFVLNGGDRAIPEAIFGVRREYLEAAFNEMELRYGTIEQYFANGLGINAEQQKRLKAMFLAPRLQSVGY